MELTNSSLRTILSNIFGVDEDYIVPKQGNWFNPQSMLPTAEKPKTWIAYKIVNNTPVTLPSYEDDTIEVEEEDVDINIVKVTKIASIDLQFVGNNAESLANGVSMWIKRSDVQAQFETVNGKLMANNMDVVTSDFYQDGFNSVLAYNVRIQIAWVHTMQAVQDKIETVLIEGGIII
jgi:hypothetical protein